MIEWALMADDGMIAFSSCKESISLPSSRRCLSSVLFEPAPSHRTSASLELRLADSLAGACGFYWLRKLAMFNFSIKSLARER